ncbi:hypothetical protein FB45DRAFT_907503 [Roridomyces roridus]|uniref:Uncharacterized protein n=1 Tax=Roridomyces roridus TaxID=1738132 RepID=A0AAD7FTB2_9AGAR|nr:hypothetical protein FB45DRAFT_907503 [Roridomyces roridus]
MPSSPNAPPGPNPSIVNASNILPSVNVLFDEVSHRERSNSQSSPVPRPHISAWSGFPGPERDLLGRGSPGGGQAPLTPLQMGPRSPPQVPTQVRAPAPRPVAEAPRQAAPAHPYSSAPTFQVQLPQNRPVIPSRMGGRYAQTPCHPNGQPHAPGLVPNAPYHPPGHHAAHAARKTRPPGSGSRVPRGSAPINGETSQEAAARIFQELLQTFPHSDCPQCVHDVHIESRRQVAGSHGAAFAAYAHGSKPQIPTALPTVEGLINIPFTPKPARNQTLFGVSLAEILDFRDVLDDPRERVLPPNTEKIYLTIEHPGYPSIVKVLTGNCPHRPISRFNLAYNVAEAFYTYFTVNPFNQAAVPPGVPAIRAVTQLRLINLYTTDNINFRAHLAYVF